MLLRPLCALAILGCALVIASCDQIVRPAAVCTSSTTLERLTDIILDDTSHLYTLDGAPITVGQAEREQVRTYFRQRLEQITIAESDQTTGRITCDAVFFPRDGDGLQIQYDSAPDLSGPGRVVRAIDAYQTTNLIRADLVRLLREVAAGRRPAIDPEPHTTGDDATSSNALFAVASQGATTTNCGAILDSRPVLAGRCRIDATTTETRVHFPNGGCLISLVEQQGTVQAVIRDRGQGCELQARYGQPLPFSFGPVRRQGDCWLNGRISVCAGHNYDPARSVGPIPPSVRETAEPTPRYDPSELARPQLTLPAPPPATRDVRLAVERAVEGHWRPDCGTAQPGLFRVEIRLSDDGQIVGGPTLRTDVAPAQLRNANLAMAALREAAPFRLPPGARAQTLTLAFDTTTACGAFQ